jgi:hypothetical protein
MLKKYLDALEKVIDPQSEELLMQSWIDFVEGNFKGDLFLPSRVPVKTNIDWPSISVNEALDNNEKMAIQQLRYASECLETSDGVLMTIRPNYGSSIIPSIFGTEIFYMDDASNTLPTALHFPEGINEIPKILSAGIPDLSNGQGSKVFEMQDYFIDMMKGYPNLQKYCHIGLPDFQSSMDVCELLVGSEIFLGVYDQDVIIKELLDLITETLIASFKKWSIKTPLDQGYGFEDFMLFKGGVMLKDDSAVNFSPEMFDEFIKPYDQKLLNQFGGGAIHFCGKGDHFIENMSQIDGLYGVNFSQPELNDLDIIFKNTVDKGIKILALRREVAHAEVKSGRNLHSCVQSMAL